MDQTETTIMTTETFKETAYVLLDVWHQGYFSLVKKSPVLTGTGGYASVSLAELGEEIEKQEVRFKNIAGFWHTHPPGSEYISNIDTATAQAYSFSYAKKILMIIATDSGWYKAWYVDDDEVVTNARVLKLPFDYFFVFVP